MNKSKLSEAIKDCKYPLKISFSFDAREGNYCLSLGYEGCFPLIIRYENVPEDLNLVVETALAEFDIEEKNKQMNKRSLQDTGERKVRPIEAKNSSSTKPSIKKKVKFARSLI